MQKRKPSVTRSVLLSMTLRMAFIPRGVQINAMTVELEALMTDLEALMTDTRSNRAEAKLEQLIGKNDRKVRRSCTKAFLSVRDLEMLEEALRQESASDQRQVKSRKAESLEQVKETIDHQLHDLKKRRSELAAQLTRQMFQEYAFLNSFGEEASLLDIFAKTTLESPKAGAGDCAAPKHFQAAFNRPIQKVDFDQGKPAVTYYKILGTEEQISVSGKVLNPTRAYLYPVTGRTHHLRVHATHSMGVDLAMVGDDLYGKRDKRLCPHAGFLELKYPMTMRRMKFVCDVPF